jgi:hypothetical protein
MRRLIFARRSSARRMAMMACVLVALARPAVAHHSGAMFDDKKEVTLTGTIKEFQYTNPHSWLIVDVKSADGKTTTWGFEAEGPTTLLRAGIKRTDLMPGMEITITGHPMRDGRPAATFVKAVRLADNKVFVPGAGFAVK